MFFLSLLLCRQDIFFLLLLSRFFSLSLIFCSLNMIMGRCSFCLFLYLTCLVFSELPGSVVWCLTLIWGNSHHYCLKYFFCFCLSFFSFQYSHYIYWYITPFVIVSQLLNILGFFFQSFFSWLSVLEVSLVISSRSEIFFLTHVQCIIEPIRDILHFCYSVSDL